ncbi:hypothetical protein [Mycoplana dimorpha]|uniref:TolB-like protein n=1 Tax=Mycoplana dimorpha TaxID=28320 RepID=A0A2T5BEB6_MYCDI|nr:hypothetical protein [Mycoplana dimorpha]PTM97345.1 TolB-like protein [Mycoplana dimorpha]
MTLPDSAPADVSAPPTNNEIREQLARIRSSPSFDAPDRAQRFLTYVIEEALQGRADRIKAYSIAIEVFGRDATFDAQNDPVVRIEAGRVRRALERYYLLAGQKDPILITMPKGGYVPVFTRFNEVVAGTGRPPTAPLRLRERGAQWLAGGVLVLAIGVVVLATLPGRGREVGSGGHISALSPDMPSVVVMPFEDITGSHNTALFARGLTDEVIGQMARFKEIAVIAGRSTDGAGAVQTDPPKAGLPVYALEGRVRSEDDKLRLTARLVSLSDGTVIWANSYDAQLNVRELLDIEADLARAVATTLAQPYGVIFQADAAQMLQSPPEDWKAYACTLSYYGYRAALSPSTHASVQTCLKDVVERFPNYATAWALLSLTYIDELRFRYRLEAPFSPPIDLAVEAADRAVELDPQNVRALQAQMLAYFFRGDVPSALAIGERAVGINPNDTELSGEYGFRLALSGQWQKGCDMVADAVRSNPGPMGYYQAALAICAYIDGDYERAESWARSTDFHDNPLYHLVLIAILGQRGNLVDAAAERSWVEEHAPEFLHDIRKEISLRIHRKEDQDRFFDGLRKAGLQLPPA